MGTAEPFYRDDLVEIWRGDCLEVLPRLAAEGLSADLVLTDPPYGISREDRVSFKGRDVSLFFGDWDVFSGEEEFWRFTFAWADEALAVLRPGGVLCSFFDRDKINFLSAYLRKRHGCKSKGYFVWIKANPVPQLRKVKWMNAWEIVGMWQKPGGSLCYNWELGQRPDWLMAPIPGNTAKEDGPRLHPTQKPVRVAELFVAYWTPPGGLVVDPFLGSGTTAVAAKRLGRRCVGIELDEGWCRAAAERCAQRTVIFGPPGGRQGRIEFPGFRAGGGAREGGPPDGGREDP